MCVSCARGCVVLPPVPSPSLWRRKPLADRLNSSNHSAPPRWIDADVYLFDIDGTLLHATGRAHYHAFNVALKHCFGLDSTIDGVPWHGSTDVAILRAVLDREGVDTADLQQKMPEMIRHMAEH